MIEKLREAFLAGFAEGDAAGSLAPYSFCAGEDKAAFKKWHASSVASDEIVLGKDALARFAKTCGSLANEGYDVNLMPFVEVWKAFQTHEAREAAR